MRICDLSLTCSFPDSKVNWPLLAFQERAKVLDKHFHFVIFALNAHLGDNIQTYSLQDD